MSFIKRQSPGRIIALGFAMVILVGSLLLMLPCSIQDLSLIHIWILRNMGYPGEYRYSNTDTGETGSGGNCVGC